MLEDLNSQLPRSFIFSHLLREYGVGSGLKNGPIEEKAKAESTNTQLQAF